MATPPTNNAVQLLGQLRDLWNRQSRRRTLAVLLVLGVGAAVGWTELSQRSEKWSTVGDGASPDDAHELYASLQARGIAARLRGGKVEVPNDRVDEARAVAAGAGLPRSGRGFELFDEDHLGQSSFSEQVNYRRALQGELARSITALAQVDGARVHLALGKRSVFKDQDESPSASVALHLHPGQLLTNAQVVGVRQLVAASVEGLQPGAVVIVDNHGNLLDAGDPSASDRKVEIERTVTARVRTMVERLVGLGKVSVVTTADVDMSKTSETQEIYDKDNPAVRSEARTIEGGDASTASGGLAGTRANLPGAPGATTATTPGQGQRVQETKNYELSRTVRQTTSPDAKLQRLHVAIIVDHRRDADGKPVARSPEELAELTAIARQAAGIDDARGDKIELRSIAFAPDEPTAAIADVAVPGLPITYVAIGGGAGALLLTFVLVVALRRKRPLTPMPMLALPAPVAELERVLDARHAQEARHALDRALGGDRSPPPELPAGRPVQERVLDAVRGDVDRTAELLSVWLAEPAAKAAKT